MRELVQNFLEDSARRYPNKLAVVCRDHRLTYAQLEDAANDWASRLQRAGVSRGDRVAIYLPNSVEAIIGIFGILKAGGVFVAVNRAAKLEKLGFILKHCGARVLITNARVFDQGVKKVETRRLDDAPMFGEFLFTKTPCRSLAAQFRRQTFAVSGIPPAITPAVTERSELDLACLIYTSGTTGEPKGVMCGHSNVVFITRAIAEYLKHTERDVVLSVLPLSFSYGLYQLLTTVCVGGTLVLEESFAFPAAVLQQMVREQVTGFAGVPTIYSIILGMDLREFDLSRLRYLTNAAAGLSVEHVKRLRQLFPNTELYLMHGLTEVARTMYLPPDQADRRPASSGIAVPGTELWIEDESGRRLGPGEVGELVVRGPHVMRGYWADPKGTAQRFRPGPSPGERICYSGDLFRTDAEGFFYFVSRKDDIIKCRGEKVAPQEVENVLCSMPGIQDAAVVGVPDPLLGQAVKAFVVAADSGLTAAKVMAYCQARLEPVMVPQKVEFRRELTKTDNGKIRRFALR